MFRYVKLPVFINIKSAIIPPLSAVVAQQVMLVRYTLYYFVFIRFLIVEYRCFQITSSLDFTSLRIMVDPHPCHPSVYVGLGQVVKVATFLVKSDGVGADVASWQLCVDGYLVF